jgi:hypothetical protein
MTSELDPAEALAMARGARERVAARAAASPGWYAPVYGLCCGGIVAGGGLRQPLGILLIAFSTLAVVLLYRHWQNKTGLSVSGYRKGWTRVIALALVVMMVGLMLAGLGLRTEFGLAWAPLACGAVTAVFAAWGSIVWDYAWRAQMTDDMQ